MPRLFTVVVLPLVPVARLDMRRVVGLLFDGHEKLLTSVEGNAGREFNKPLANGSFLSYLDHYPEVPSTSEAVLSVSSGSGGNSLSTTLPRTLARCSSSDGESFSQGLRGAFILPKGVTPWAA
jgi:hypothetical protein